MTLPTQELRWASAVVDESIMVDGQLMLVTNREEPPAGFKNTGVLAREPLTRQDLNWYNWLAAEYINHLVERYGVGDVHTTTIDTPDPEISERLGGEWQQYGSQTVGGVATYFYRKVA